MSNLMKNLVSYRDKLVSVDENIPACLVDGAIEELKALSIKYSDLGLENERLERELEEFKKIPARQNLIRKVWGALRPMKDQDRILFIDDCFTNYCVDCGIVEIDNICHCQRDD